MGNLYSIIGFFSGLSESWDEEEGRAATPSLCPWQCCNGNLSYKAIKDLFRFIVSKLRWPWKRTSEDPILPVENPRATPIRTGNEYDITLLLQPFIDPYFHECDRDIVEAHASPQDNIIFVPNSVSNKEDDDEEVVEEDKTVIMSSIERIRYEVNAYPQDKIIFISDLVSNEEDDDNEEEDTTVIMNSVERIWCKANASPKDNRIFVPDSVSNGEEVEEKEDKTVILSSIVERIRWIKHYSSQHRILLVGDGDFSFSAALAVAFGRASNMIATSLDSEAFLEKNYRNAMFNVTELRKRECKVMHGIDATKIAKHTVLGHLKFERIVYNFPFAGFFKNLSRDAQLRCHRRLVSRFLKNAREMMSENGEIHISHKINGFHAEWKLESIASCHGLRLIEAVGFNHLDYPGYHTKCGFGGDSNFNCNPSKTYKFGFKTFGY